MKTKRKIDSSWFVINFVVFVVAFACGMALGMSIEQNRSNYCENCDEYYSKNMNYCNYCGKELQRTK